jgi:hypothetical protein
MLATLTQLKNRLGITLADTTDDGEMELFLGLVSARFNRYCRRTFERSAAATLEFRASEMVVLVDRYPIEAVTGFDLKASELEGWVDQGLTGADYLIGPTGNTIELLTVMGNRQELARVRYAGGYVEPGTDPEAGQVELPADLNRAAIEQVVYLWQNKTRLGLTTVGGTGGSLAQFAELDLLPLVTATLNNHIRFTL